MGLTIKNRISKEFIFHIAFWIFYFSFVNTIWNENWFDNSLNPNYPLPTSVLFFPIFFYLNAFWLIPKYFNRKGWHKYFLTTALVVLLFELPRLLITISLEVNNKSFFENLLAEAQGKHSFIFGIGSISFYFSFAYRLTKDWIVNQKLIEKLKTEKISMELSLLKSQINPHFLFNNLNALDDLIDRDQSLAKKYLHKLSNIYRYLITNMDKDVVQLEEEWKLIEDYIYLIEERFGNAYKFVKTNEIGNLSKYLIPPASLQSLLENVIKHNQGNIDDPLVVKINISEEGVSVSNIKRPKKTEISSFGTGLNNLKVRYNILSDKNIKIIDNKEFIVTLPFIKLIT